jgi:hypothetical protein
LKLTHISKSGPNTLAAYKNASSAAEKNVSPTVAAGFGGKLSEGGNMTSGSNTSTGTGPSSTGGASHLAGSAVFAGAASFFAYLLI